MGNTITVVLVWPDAEARVVVVDWLSPYTMYTSPDLALGDWPVVVDEETEIVLCVEEPV